MLKYHHQRYWWWQPFLQWFYVGLSPAVAFTEGNTWEMLSSSIEPGTLLTPITLFPSEDEDVTYYGNDILLPRVENYDGILFGDEKVFEYRGHTWNDVSNFKVIGDVYNLPTGEVRKIGSWDDYREYDRVNPITGNKYAAYFPIIWNKSKHYSYTATYKWSISHVSTNDRITAFHIPIFHYFDKRTNNVYQGYVATWHEDGEGKLVDAYLNPVGSQGNYAYWPMTFYVYRIVGMDPGGRPHIAYSRVPGLYDMDGVLRNDVQIFRGTTTSQVISKLEALCRIDGDYEGPLTPGGRRYGVTITWPDAYYFRMLGNDPEFGEFKQPNYQAWFPQKDRSHYYCNWNAIAAEAYQTLGMTDMNGIAGLHDILNFNEDVHKMAETLRSLPSKQGRAVASAYLGVHYGFKLMVLDAKGLLDTMIKYADDRINLKRCQASYKWEVGTGNSKRTYTSRYQVYYDEFAQVEKLLDQLLQIADFDITLENWWDMVSMSFVVDWFVGIGDVLQAIDIYSNLQQRHEVICCGRSIKGVRQLNPRDLFGKTTLGYFAFDVRATYYTRQYQKKLILPSLVPSVTINPFNHSIEGAALIISRL
nr:maturation protein [Leviviridae sp.]